MFWCSGEKFCVILCIFYSLFFSLSKQNKNVLGKPIEPSLPSSITKTNCTEKLPMISEAFDWIFDRTPPIQWPAYNYLGPGTRLEDNLRKNVQPKNPLDAAAKIHDHVYVQYKDMCHRHLADKYLEEEAWKRVVANDSSLLEEKIPAWITTNVLKLKQWLNI